MPLRIGLVEKEDIEEILYIYQSVIGTKGCSWNEFYPDEEIIRKDWEANTLYCAKNEKNEIVAACAINTDEEIDALPFWSKNLTPVGEIMRLVVKPIYQNQGIARQMIKFSMKKMKDNGYKAVHFLVSQTNEKAIRSYAKFNFQNVGEVTMYDNDWYCYEKEIQ